MDWQRIVHFINGHIQKEDAFNEELNADNVLNWLGDGRVLCLLANAVDDSGSMKIRDKRRHSKFHSLESITLFLRWCRDSLSFVQGQRFHAQDLMEKQNPKAVYDCILNVMKAVGQTEENYSNEITNDIENKKVADNGIEECAKPVQEVADEGPMKKKNSLTSFMESGKNKDSDSSALLKSKRSVSKLSAFLTQMPKAPVVVVDKALSNVDQVQTNTATENEASKFSSFMKDDEVTDMHHAPALERPNGPSGRKSPTAISHRKSFSGLISPTNSSPRHSIHGLHSPSANSSPRMDTNEMNSRTESNSPQKDLEIPTVRLSNEVPSTIPNPQNAVLSPTASSLKSLSKEPHSPATIVYTPSPTSANKQEYLRSFSNDDDESNSAVLVQDLSNVTEFNTSKVHNGTESEISDHSMITEDATPEKTSTCIDAVEAKKKDSFDASMHLNKSNDTSEQQVFEQLLLDRDNQIATLQAKLNTMQGKVTELETQNCSKNDDRVKNELKSKIEELQASCENEKQLNTELEQKVSQLHDDLEMSKDREQAARYAAQVAYAARDEAESKLIS